MHRGLIDSPDELARRIRDITTERTMMLGEDPVTYTLPPRNFAHVRDMLLGANGTVVPRDANDLMKCKHFWFEGAHFKQQEA